MSDAELLPERSTFALGESVGVEARGVSSPGTATIWSLGDLVRSVEYDGGGRFSLGRLRAGTYGVELETAEGVLRTAIEVTSDSRARLRYGFAVDYSPDRDLTGISDLIRRLHLTDIQFYDWAYRHADLLGGGEVYRDALDQPIELETVRRLITATQDAGARALGYAAVYAVGPNEWADWQDLALLAASGEPYALGDFLFLVDPAAERWQASFTGQLAAASAGLGFDGYHLDQYGYPKRAVRPDGAVVDVSRSFVSLIGAARQALPAAHLVFNNVNDFPTWATADTPQDAVYIEVWEPQVTLGALAEVVTRARSVARGKPVVIAAYQHVYDSASAEESDRATALTMATLFSHGATGLLAGEADRILVDPYYVRNHRVEASTAALLKRWYDFLVEHDALLADPAIVDVTGSYAGDYNDGLDVGYADARVTQHEEPGTVWRRITEVDGRLVVHLINLVGQHDTLWDAPRSRPGVTGPGTLRFKRLRDRVPRVLVADPDAGGRLVPLTVEVDGDHATAILPDFTVWQLVSIELDPASRLPTADQPQQNGSNHD